MTTLTDIKIIPPELNPQNIVTTKIFTFTVLYTPLYMQKSNKFCAYTSGIRAHECTHKTNRSSCYMYMYKKRKSLQRWHIRIKNNIYRKCCKEYAFVSVKWSIKSYVISNQKYSGVSSFWCGKSCRDFIRRGFAFL